ncbi:MAG: DUF748 domain-containing protein [Opitutaceae bacterium]
MRATERIVAVVVVLLIAVRLAAPYVLKNQINHRLQKIPGFTGSVQDVGLHVWHGGYSMHDLRVLKRGAHGNEPFISAKDITFTIDYGQLIHGKLVSDIVVTDGALNFKKSPNPVANQSLGVTKAAPKQLPKPARPWRDAAKDLFPIDITYLRFVDSTLHYVDDTERPAVDVKVDHLNLEATGLRNRPSHAKEPYPAVIAAHGTTIGHGDLRVDIRIDPLAAAPHFQLFLLLQNVWLPALNPMLLAHAKVDLNRGYLQLYAEITADNGTFRGYVKPILTDLNFNTGRDKDRPLELLWKDVVSDVSKLIRSKRHKQVATIIPFHGKFSATETVNIWGTIGNLLRNGFIAALRHGLEPNVRTVSGKARS